VEDCICSVGQEIASLAWGPLTPHILVNRKFDLCPKKQLKVYFCLDAPPKCVKPIPMPLVASAIADAYSSLNPLIRAMGNFGVIGLFLLLLWHGEHVYSINNNNASPFQLQDVDFIILGTHRYHAAIYILYLLPSPMQIFLTFTKQKNGTFGKTWKHGSASHVIMSPVLAVL
jgi:hypothetical protein